MTELDLKQKTRNQTREIFLFCFCALYIALFCWLGRYARPQADDYFYAFSTLDKGFFSFQKFHYSNVNGRILNVFLVSFACLFSMEAAYPLLPLLTILFYTLAANFLINALVSELSVRIRWLLTLLLTSATLAFVSSLNETLYWLSGMPYFWTSVILMILLGLAIRALQGSKSALWIGCIVCFMNGMLLEQPCVFQGIVAFLAVLYFLWRKDRRSALICGTFWLLSITAFLVNFLSPGTTTRIGTYAYVPILSRLMRTLLAAVVFGGITVIKFFLKPITWILLLFVPLINATISSPRAPRLRGWQIFVITITIAPLMHAINGWATGGGLPERGESLTIWMMGITWLLLWTFCYKVVRFKKIFAWRWAVLILALLLNFNFANLTYELVTGSAERYAAEYDDRDAETVRQRDAGVRDVVIPLLAVRPNLLFYEDLDLWNTGDFWKNKPYAEYWSIRSVRAFPEGMCKAPDALIHWDSSDISDMLRLAETDGAAAFLVGRVYDWLFTKVGEIEKNDTEAIRWYAKAANLGHRKAARMPVHLYSRNSTLHRRYFYALYWLIRSQFPLNLS